MTALRKTPVALMSNAAPFAIRAERTSDVVAREALLDGLLWRGPPYAHLPAPARTDVRPPKGLALFGGARGTVGRKPWRMLARQRRGCPGADAGGRWRWTIPAAASASAPRWWRRAALDIAGQRGHGRGDPAGRTRPTTPRFGFFGREDRRTGACPVRSSATACSASNSARARSTAPGA